MKKQIWAILVVVLLSSVLLLSPYVNKYDSLGWLSFGIVFIIIPYTLYRALPSNQASLLVAVSSPLILGFAWGYWLNSYATNRLDATGINAEGVVTATWLRRTRNGGSEKLFRIRYKVNSVFREGFSHKNEMNYKIGDSVRVVYLPSEPNTYQILR